jgi:hypothetical protein
MKTKKITSKTRIKVRSALCRELGYSPWDRYRLKDYMMENYEMGMTSKRMGVYYFQVYNPKKLSLFILKYSEHLC